MKIRLTVDLPISPAEGMAKGRDLEVVRYNSDPGRGRVMFYVTCDTGAEVGVLMREAEITDNSNKPRDEAE